MSVEWFQLGVESASCSLAKDGTEIKSVLLVGTYDVEGGYLTATASCTVHVWQSRDLITEEVMGILEPAPFCINNT